MGILESAAEKIASGVAQGLAGIVGDKISVKKEDIQKFEFDNHLWIEKKSGGTNAKSVVLDDYGKELYTMKRKKYGSNHPTITLSARNGDVCIVSLQRKFMSSKVFCNINMAGKECVIRKGFGYLEKTFLAEFGYSFDYKMKGSYSIINDGNSNIIYTKDYFHDGETGTYLEYKNDKLFLLGLTFIMIQDIVRDGLKIVDRGYE